MIRNFQVEDNIALTCGGDYYDLHNDFQFLGIILDILESSLILKWQSRKTSSILTVRFSGLFFFKVRPAEAGYPAAEKTVLNAVGFAWPDDTETMSSFIPNATEDSYHLLFEFMDGFAVRVFAENACLETKSS